jgi:dTDP-4-dehydrorhamnose 3,5-epimerase
MVNSDEASGDYIGGVHSWNTRLYQDSRGTFEKIFSIENQELDSRFQLAESFITTSKQGVVRGMHVQLGRSQSARVIKVLSGEIYDVLIDLRELRSEPKIQTREMSAALGSVLLVPPGVAHGFQALTSATILYLSSNVHVPELDSGVNPLSIGVEWPIEISEMSTRDLELPRLERYKNGA